MGNGWKSKSVVAGAVIATALSFAGEAHAAKSGTWRPSTGLSGMSPGAFRLACTEIYGGRATFESGVWTCEMPDGSLVACGVDTSDATSTNCRTYTPASITVRKAGGGQLEYFGPMQMSR